MSPKFLYLLIIITISFIPVSYSQLSCPLFGKGVDVGPDKTICKGGCTTLNASLFKVTVPATDSYYVDSFAYQPYRYDSGKVYNLTQDDVYGDSIPLPFNFCFFGNKYSKCLIGANGELGFDLSLANQSITWPISGPIPTVQSGTINSIMCPYQDLYIVDGGTIYYATYGVAPCRVFVVSWDSVAYFTEKASGASCPGDFGVQQIVLHESSNQIDINIKQKPYCLKWNSGKAIIGIENQAGTKAYAVPGKNATVFSLTNGSYSFIPAGVNNTTTNYTWFDAANNKVDTGRTITVCPTVTQQYVLRAQVYPACDTINSYDTVVVNVIPAPLPLKASNNGPLCLNDTLALQATFTMAGYTYSWTGPHNFTSNLQNPFRNGVVAADSGMYVVRDTLAGCPSQIDSTNVLVDNLVAGIATDKKSVCAGDTLHISFGGHAPDTNSYFKWSFAYGKLASGNPSDTSRGPFAITWDSLGNKIITLSVQNWRCKSSVIDTIPVNYHPVIAYALPKDICVGDTVSLQVADYSLVNADSLFWNFGNANIIDGGTGNSRGNYHLSYSDTGRRVISLAIKFSQCLSSPVLDTVMVHALPVAKIESVSKNNVCAGDTVTFIATRGSLEQYYVWTPANWFSGKGSYSNTISGIIESNGTVYLHVKDLFNCSNNDSVAMITQPCCTISLPSGFTPNGDGRNDVFRPITSGHHKVKIFRVVNRYGQTVFQSNVEVNGWDGRFNGVPQDMGTYYYYLNYTCNGKEYEMKGDIALVR
ncbi:MAG: gliding motility-associated C-terminal domain-containing protein [Taibaiella sp.]|nr:gliding motility-associated C-terminal domain-containing protein [Taibaiella sp.]